MIRTLDNFDAIHIVRQMNDRGWEPFDRLAAGEITDNDLVRCLKLIYGPKSVFMEELNDTYLKTARYAIDDFDKTTSIGFKIRDGKRSAECLKKIFSVLSENNVVAFVNIRKDVLRWALSRYHGDGSGKGTGHLQFALAKGKITHDEIPKLYVDLKKLKKMIDHCIALNSKKNKLLKDLADYGIESYPLYYEDFCSRKLDFFRTLLLRLDLEIPADEILKTLEKEVHLRKVHSDDIKTFVINYEEVLKNYGDLGAPLSGPT